MGKWWIAGFLALTVIVVLSALLVQASRSPTFRAADHADLGECLRSIPTEWRRGSLEYGSAETACYYLHRPHPTPP
jgi:hypothetical protein